MPRTKKIPDVKPSDVGPASEPAAEKTAAKRVKKTEELYLQMGGREWNLSDCKERVAAAYAADGHKASGIKKLVVYFKPEEGKAYYVINDTENGSIDL